MSDYPKTGSYKPEELRFAATARCECGAGLAYPPKDAGISCYWDCSAVLMGMVQPGIEHPTYAFAFYGVKSELQPSAYGATTRPADAAPRRLLAELHAETQLEERRLHAMKTEGHDHFHTRIHQTLAQMGDHDLDGFTPEPWAHATSTDF